MCRQTATRAVVTWQCYSSVRRNNYWRSGTETRRQNELNMDRTSKAARRPSSSYQSINQSINQCPMILRVDVLRLSDRTRW